MRIFIALGLGLLFINNVNAQKPIFISTSYEEIRNDALKHEFTIVYLWMPWCKPCVKKLSFLNKVNNIQNCKVVLICPRKENVSIVSKYGFDTCYYFNTSIYKTHTTNYDEFNQITDEFFKGIPQNKDLDKRVIMPATFILNKKQELIYYSKDGLEKEEVIELLGVK